MVRAPPDSTEIGAGDFPSGRATVDGRAPVILLASTCPWPSTSKLAIALAGASCAVVVLTPGGHPLNIAAVVQGRFRYSASRPLRSLAVAIARARPDLIVACDDRVVEHLHRLHGRTGDVEVRALIERSLGDPDEYAITNARAAVMAAADHLGIAIPVTQSIHTRDDLRRRAAVHPFPWVLKVDGSWGGVGVRIVATLAEAERAFADLSRRFRPLYGLRRLILGRDPFWLAPWMHQPPGRVSVQQFISGRPANCVIAAWRGAALDGIAVDVIASEGRTGPASIVRRVRDGRMMEAAARLVETFRLSGLIGFDFLIEDATGRAILLEMNARATPIAHLRLGRGHDPVAALVSRLTGVATEAREAETLCPVIALFPQAEQQFHGQAILAGAYSDAPPEDPRLVRALMRRRVTRRAPVVFGASAAAE
jgi:hypothetical protein